MGRKIDGDALIDWLEDGYDEDHASQQEQIDHAFTIGLINAMSEEQEA